jgi:hypothetical protein
MPKPRIKPLPKDGGWEPAFPLPKVEIARGPRGGLYVKWTFQDGEYRAMMPKVTQTFAKKLLEVAKEAERLQREEQKETS